MKKHIFSIACMIVLLVSLVSVCVFAESGTYGLLKYEVTSNQTISITRCDTKATGEIIIPETIEGYTVTSIGFYAFANCSQLTSVVIPDEVTSIGQDAFRDCKKLKNITLPQNLNDIGNSAFQRCESLTAITLPDTTTFVDSTAFLDCSKLSDIMVSDGNTEFSSYQGVLFSKDRTIIKCCPCGKEGVYNIPNTVICIDDHAFSGCSKLTEIHIPKSVTTINDYAFSHNMGLTSISIPENVTSVGDSVFMSCHALERVTLPNTIKTIGEDAFSDCGGLTSIDIPKGVTSVKDRAFYYCTSLKNISIPESVTSIGDKVFAYCKNLSSIEIPDSVSSMGTYVFYESGLEKIAFPESLTSVNDGTFSYCRDLTEVTIPNSIKSIGTRAFENCNSLEKIVLPEKLSSIGNRAFIRCEKINNIIIPDSITFIPGYAFCQCVSMDSIVIPDSIKSIDENAFSGCSGLRRFVIPKNVEIVASHVFYDCENLSEITMSDSIQCVEQAAFLHCNSLTDIYYLGSEDNWNQIQIADYNDPLINATKHFEGLSIIDQPQNANSIEGTIATFAVTATGNNLTYQWQYCSAGSTKWKDSGMPGSDTPVVSVPATIARNGQKYRCIVSDVMGNSEATNVAMLTVTSAFDIVTQPKNIAITAGDTAKFEVVASKDNLCYQWQYKSPSGNWKNNTSKTVGYNTANLEVETTAGRDKYQYRCIVTDKAGNAVTSSTATLRVLAIKTHPSDVEAKIGTTAEFAVKATGSDTSYQWQYCSAGSTKWKNSGMTGNSTATISVPATEARNGQQYRCVVTDGSGNSVTSNAATLTVKVELAITTQPSNVTVDDGATAKFTVKATGNNLNYQWQYYTTANGKWKDSGMTGNTTATVSVPATIARNGQKYRCIITDSNDDTIVTKAVTLNVK